MGEQVKEVKLSEKEAINIMVNLVCNKLFILAPLYFRQNSGISALITTTAAFTVAVIIWNVYCKYCHLSITGCKKNTISYTIVMIIALICIIIIPVTLQQYCLEIKSTVLSNTPDWIIVLSFLIPVLATLKYNFHNIGVQGNIFVPFVFIVALIMVTLSVSKPDLFNLFPAITLNHNTFLPKMILILSMLFELIFMYFLPDLLKQDAKIKNIGNSVILRSFIYYSFISVIFSIVLPHSANLKSVPFFKLIKMAHIGGVHIKLDSLFLILYCISAYIYTSSMLMFILKMIRSQLSKKYDNIIRCTVTGAICVLSLLPDVNRYLYDMLGRYYFVLSLITFAFPVLIIILNKVLLCKSKK